MTPPTSDLLKIMLLDSAHIQEMEAQWKSRKRLRHGGCGRHPALYPEGRDGGLSALLRRDLWRSLLAGPGITVTFRDAGHPRRGDGGTRRPGEWGAKPRRLSGDIGRPAQLLMQDPTMIEEADFLFMESTYGNRNHKDEAESRNELAEAIAYSYARGEKVIIPAFAVERTQEMIYSLHLLAKEGRLPADMPVFVDSPLAIQATEIFRRYRDYMDAETKRLFANGEDPPEPFPAPLYPFDAGSRWRSTTPWDRRSSSPQVEWPMRAGSSTTSAITSGVRGRASSSWAFRRRDDGPEDRRRRQEGAHLQ